MLCWELVHFGKFQLKDCVKLDVGSGRIDIFWVFDLVLGTIFVRMAHR